MEQLLLFEQEKDEHDDLWKAIVDVKESLRKVQKRLFAEQSELKDRLTEAQAEVERLKYKLELKEWKINER